MKKATILTAVLLSIGAMADYFNPLMFTPIAFYGLLAILRWAGFKIMFKIAQLIK